MAFSPIAQRRFLQFRRNRRGYYAAWIFSFLFLLCLCAELIANDKPIVLRYDGDFYFPVIKSYPETVFGGEFETEAQYRDPFVRGLVEQKGWMVWPPIRYSYDTINYDLDRPAPSPPSRENWLGTDDQGRDVLARLIYGFRISVLFGLILTLLGSAIGVTIGAIEGYFGGWVDLLTQRFIEIWGGMPVLFLLIIMSSVIAPGFFTLLGLMLLFSWMTLVDVVRAEFFKLHGDHVARDGGVAAGQLQPADPAVGVGHAAEVAVALAVVEAVDDLRAPPSGRFSGRHSLPQACWMAGTGPRPMTSGGTPAMPHERMRTCGFRPSSFARCAVASAIVVRLMSVSTAVAPLACAVNSLAWG